MRTYLYGCAVGHLFERQGGLDASVVDCDCGESARRRPFSSVPHLKGETVAKAIPDPHYRNEAEKRDLNQSWGDSTKSLELMRGAKREDSQGRVFIDTPSLSRAS